MEFLKSIVKELDNEFAGVADQGVVGDTDAFIDTGSYAFNALLSGTIFGGLPSNKVTALAGESSTGKTFYALGICKSFLSTDENSGIIYFETEGALTKKMLEDRGIDTSRFVIVPVSTIQEFRTQAVKILEGYEKTKKGDRPPLMMCLDSLGMLSTSKEMEDAASGKDVRDMTRAQLIRGAFRILSLKLSKLDVPMLVTNHTYTTVGSYIPMQEMGGGSGLKYASSTIIYLSKKKERDGTEIVGNIIKCKAQKSRLTKENSEVETRLYYDRGLDRYYGLPQLALKYDVWKKAGSYIQLQDGKKVYEKTILSEPEKYFTEEVMAQLEEASAQEFRYGG